MIGETLTVTRGSNDNKGNWTATGEHTIQGCLAWGTWSRNLNERAESSKGNAELYVIKGVDVVKRDRVSRADGQKFWVVSHAMWDEVHAITGHNFGMAVYQLEAING